jgi:hypothetical protein
MAMRKLANVTGVARFQQNGSWHVVPVDGVLMRKKERPWIAPRAFSCDGLGGSERLAA